MEAVDLQGLLASMEEWLPPRSDCGLESPMQERDGGEAHGARGMEVGTLGIDLRRWPDTRFSIRDPPGGGVGGGGTDGGRDRGPCWC